MSWENENWQDQQDPFVDPNAATQSGGGPQGGDSQQANESQAVDQALGSGDDNTQTASSSSSPVNGDGSISSTYTPYNQTYQASGNREVEENNHVVSYDPNNYGDQAPLPVHSGANSGSGPWAPGYDPGAGWNNGVPPVPGYLWNMTTGSWTPPPGGAGAVNYNLGGQQLAIPGQTKSAVQTTGGGGAPAPKPTYGPPAAQTNNNTIGGGAKFGRGNGQAFNIPGFDNSRYTPGQVSQFVAPQQSAEEKAQMAALMGALGNSEWSSDRIGGMKEQQKELALKMRGESQRDINDRFAGAGRSGAGQQEGLLRRANSESMSQLLGAYRGVDQNAAGGRRQELLDTTQGIQSALDAQLGRHATAYDSYLKGNQGQNDENYRGWQSQRQIESLALQRAIAEESANLDWSNQGLNLADLNERQRQFNERMGYDWTALNVGNVRK